MIYVDDLLLFATKVVVDMVLAKLKEKFQWLTVERGVVTMSYLGMQLVFGDDNITIDMVFYLEKGTRRHQRFDASVFARSSECFSSE